MNYFEQRIKDVAQTLEGETLKSLAEFTLHNLTAHSLGTPILEYVRGGKRVVDPRLSTEVADIPFESPVMVGAGWDKKGLCVDGLYALGFAGVEVGSVLAEPQAGNPKPRLFTDKTHSVGLNRMGFNSDGVNRVEWNLLTQRRPGVLGISIGKNKTVADKDAPEAHAVVAKKLRNLADYMVINVASPNTPGLRDLLKREPLTDIVQAVQGVIHNVPLFVKTTVDLTLEDLDTVLSVCVQEGVDGVIDTNTTIDNEIKAKYGWAGQMGGVSGNDETFRSRANERMKHITRETRGTGLARIGVGAIHDGETALERIKSGAQVVQMVTAIRQEKAQVARNTILDLLYIMDKEGVDHINQYVGQAV